MVDFGAKNFAGGAQHAKRMAALSQNGKNLWICDRPNQCKLLEFPHFLWNVSKMTFMKKKIKMMTMELSVSTQHSCTWFVCSRQWNCLPFQCLECSLSLHFLWQLMLSSSCHSHPEMHHNDIQPLERFLVLNCSVWCILSCHPNGKLKMARSCCSYCDVVLL